VSLTRIKTEADDELKTCPRLESNLLSFLAVVSLLMPVLCHGRANHVYTSHNMDLDVDDDAESRDVEGNAELKNKRRKIEEYMNAKAHAVYPTGVWNRQSELPENVRDFNKFKASFALLSLYLYEQWLLSRSKNDKKAQSCFCFKS